MPKKLPPATPELNRLRAAVALVAIIERELEDGRLSSTRARSMIDFCELALNVSPAEPGVALVTSTIREGICRIRGLLAGIEPPDCFARESA